MILHKLHARVAQLLYLAVITQIVFCLFVDASLDIL